MSAEAATVTGPKLLQAQANAVSASVKIRPPWAMAWPFTMSSRTVMRVTARPSPWSTSSMPRRRDASSLAIMASTLGRCGTVAPPLLQTERPVYNTTSRPGVPPGRRVGGDDSGSRGDRTTGSLRPDAGAQPAHRAARLGAGQVPGDDDPPDRPARPLGDH